jgi:hypothetical protein
MKITNVVEAVDFVNFDEPCAVPGSVVTILCQMPAVAEMAKSVVENSVHDIAVDLHTLGFAASWQVGGKHLDLLDRGDSGAAMV